MNPEEKNMNYGKMTAATVILAIIAAGVIFFAGAMYEKNKLSSLGLLKDGKNSAVSEKKSSKNKKNKDSKIEPVIENNSSDNVPENTKDNLGK